MANVLFPATKSFQVNTLSGGTLTTGLVSYWNMQGNSNDYWGTNNGTDSNMAYGSSYGLVGDGAHYNSTPNSSISFGTTGMPYGVNAPMSMSEWVYLTVAPSVGATQYFFWYGDISYHPLTGGRFNVQYYNNGGTNQLVFGTDSNYDLAVNQTLSLNTWHHIVLTYDGTTGKMYLDNSMIGSGGMVYSTGVPGYHEIGSSVVNSYYLNNGNIDEVGVWSKALSTQEITDLYNGGAGQTMVSSKVFQVDTTSSLDTGLVSYYKMEGNSGDFWNGNYGTDTSVSYSTSYGKINEGAYYNGSAYTRISTLGIAGAGTPFSIGFWVRWASLPSTFQIFTTIGDGNAGNVGYGVLYLDINASNEIEFHIFNQGSTQIVATDPTALSANTWYYYVATWDGTSSGTNIHLYRNSSLVASAALNYSITASYSGAGTSFGEYYDSSGGTSYRSTNQFDEVGIWSKVLSTTEISNLYNGGAGQTMVGNVVDLISDVDNTPTINVSTLPALTLSVNETDAESDNLIGLVVTPLYISISDVDTALGSVTVVEPRDLLNVSDADSDLDTSTIQVPTLGTINTSDFETSIDVISGLVITPLYINVSDLEIESDAASVRVPCLGHIIVSETDSDSDVITNIALNPLQLTVSDIEYANELAFMREFEFFVLEDIDVDQDYVSILIPVLLISVGDVELESESVTIQNPILGAISVSDDDLDADSITVKIPNVGNVTMTEIELEQEFVQLELVSYLDTVETEIVGENISIYTYTPGTFLVQDTEVESDFVSVLIPQLGGLAVRDSETEIDSVLLDIPTLGTINVLDSGSEEDLVSLEVTDEGLFVSDTETLSEFVIIGLIRTPQISRILQNTYNQPSIILTP